jgi:hypothetical protein
MNKKIHYRDLSGFLKVVVFFTIVFLLSRLLILIYGFRLLMEGVFG